MSQIESFRQNSLATSNFEKFKNAPPEFEWLLNFQSRNTVDAYKVAARQFLDFLGLDDFIQLRETEIVHVIAFRDYLQREGRSVKTINNRLSALSSMFDWLVERQFMSVNPVRSVKRPSESYYSVEAPYIDNLKVRQMLGRPDRTTDVGLRDYTILLTMFMTGTRISSICNLDVKDVFSVDSTDGEFWVLNLKLKGGKRYKLAVAPQLAHTLREYIKYFQISEDLEHPLFFRLDRAGKTRSRITRQGVSLLWRKYRVNSKHVPHSARATFATDALHRGHPIDDVQQTLSHSDISTTKKYDKRGHSLGKSVALTVNYL